MNASSGPVGGSTPGGGGGTDPASIAETVQRAQAIAASLARSKGAGTTPRDIPAPPQGMQPSPPMTHGSGFAGAIHPPPPHGVVSAPPRGIHVSPRGHHGFEHGGHPGAMGAEKHTPHILPQPKAMMPGRGEGGWNSVDAAAAIAAQQKQIMQQRARRAALRAMATVCAAIPKPDVKEEDILGDIKKTVHQKENGVWILDLPLQSGVCAITAASPDSWQQLQHAKALAFLRHRTGAAFVLRGRPQQEAAPQSGTGVYVRVAGDDPETVYRGAVAAWSVLSARQYLSAPLDAGEDETFDCAAAMAGEDDEFLKDVCHRTGAVVDIEEEQPQFNHVSERPGLRYSATACTQSAMDRALRLLRWRLVCIEEAWRQHSAHGFTHDSCLTVEAWHWRSRLGVSRMIILQCMRAVVFQLLRRTDTEAGASGTPVQTAASTFWQSAMPDEAEMNRRRREADERRKKRGQRSRRHASKLSFAPPPDELLTGPYAPIDQ